MISLLDTVGFNYDLSKDIYISKQDAWQRKFGYSRINDEMAVFTGMVIDCELIYFNYDNKNWLIELWKGQYGVATGCEIGIYTEKYSLPILGKRYQCANDTEQLDMHYVLIKNGAGSFPNGIERGPEKHWWLTIFKPGEFSNTTQLSMNIEIVLKDSTMLKAFTEGLEKVGYNIVNKDYSVDEATNKVAFTFNVPHSKQPISRILFEKSVQQNNKVLCDKYNEVKVTLGLTQNDPQSAELILQCNPELSKYFRV